MTKIYTIDTIHEVDDIISDLAKNIYGSRSSCPQTPADRVSFMNSYEDLFEQMMLEEKAYFEEVSNDLTIKYGVDFTSRINPNHNYALVDLYEIEWIIQGEISIREQTEEEEYSSKLRQFMPYLEAWDYGANNFKIRSFSG